MAQITFTIKINSQHAISPKNDFEKFNGAAKKGDTIIYEDTYISAEYIYNGRIFNLTSIFKTK